MELEKQNKELLEALEARTTVERLMSADQENLSAFESLQADLQQTKMALAAAQAKLEDDDSVVVKWEGKFSYCAGEGLSSSALIVYSRRTSGRLGVRSQRHGMPVTRTRGECKLCHREMAGELQCIGRKERGAFECIRIIRPRRG